MIKIKTFQLAGICVFIIGIIVLCGDILGMKYSSYSLSITTINSLVFSLITIYVGYQAIKLKLISLKLLFISITLSAFPITMFLTILFYWGTHFGNIQFETYKLQFFLLSCSLTLLCILMVGLFSIKPPGFLQPDVNFSHTRLLGKILSVLTPGLGRALVGNTLAGIIIFYLYFWIITSFSSSGFTDFL